MALFSEYYILATGQPVNHVKVLAGGFDQLLRTYVVGQVKFLCQTENPSE